MKKFVLIAQHYDMTPGTVVYAVDTKPQAITNELLTSLTEDGKTLRIVPVEKLEEAV
jgi:hypothetical protein